MGMCRKCRNNAELPSLLCPECRAADEVRAQGRADLGSMDGVPILEDGQPDWSVNAGRDV